MNTQKTNESAVKPDSTDIIVNVMKAIRLDTFEEVASYLDSIHHYSTAEIVRKLKEAECNGNQ